MASDGDWFWPLAGAAVLAWLAYDKWWKEEEPPSPPPPIFAPVSIRPSGLVYVTELDSGAVWRVNADSVKGVRSDRTFWIDQDHSKNKSERARSIMTLYRVDCDSTATARLSLVAYDGDGNVLIKQDSPHAEETFTPPGSVLGSGFDEVCKSVYDPPPVAPPPPSPSR